MSEKVKIGTAEFEEADIAKLSQAVMSAANAGKVLATKDITEVVGVESLFQGLERKITATMNPKDYLEQYKNELAAVKADAAIIYKSEFNNYKQKRGKTPTNSASTIKFPEWTESEMQNMAARSTQAIIKAKLEEVQSRYPELSMSLSAGQQRTAAQLQSENYNGLIRSSGGGGRRKKGKSTKRRGKK